jgi:hypothetical protein
MDLAGVARAKYLPRVIGDIDPLQMQVTERALDLETNPAMASRWAPCAMKATSCPTAAIRPPK